MPATSPFPARQEEIWDLLSEASFASQRAFLSQHQLDYVRSLIGPISSEHGLRYFECDTVENTVQKLADVVCENPLLQDRLGLRGTVTFESHTNLSIVDDNPHPNPAANGELGSLDHKTRQKIQAWGVQASLPRRGTTPWSVIEAGDGAPASFSNSNASSRRRTRSSQVS